MTAIRRGGGGGVKMKSVHLRINTIIIVKFDGTLTCLKYPYLTEALIRGENKLFCILRKSHTHTQKSAVLTIGAFKI